MWRLYILPARSHYHSLTCLSSNPSRRTLWLSTLLTLSNGFLCQRF